MSDAFVIALLASTGTNLFDNIIIKNNSLSTVF